MKTGKMSSVVLIQIAFVTMTFGAPTSSIGGGTLPDIVELTPTSGPTTGGTMVVAKGVNLALVNGCAYGMGSDVVEDVVASQPMTNTEVTCKMPPSARGLAGSTIVRVTEDAGSNNRELYPMYAHKVFTYYYPPSVHVVSPDHGPSMGGTMMRLTLQGLTESSDIDKAACLFETNDGEVRVPLVKESCAPKQGLTLPNCTAHCETPQVCYAHDPINQIVCKEQTVAFKISLNGLDFHDNSATGAAGDLQFTFQNEWAFSRK